MVVRWHKIVVDWYKNICHRQDVSADQFRGSVHIFGSEYALSGPEIQALGSSGLIPDHLLGGMNLEVTQMSENKYKYTLSGILRDQAELAGLLNTLYEMHMVVLSVNCLDADLDKSKP